jgi:hypothetical protein
MAQEISVKAFEQKAKRLSKKGFNRSYSSIAKNASEYVNALPLGYTDDLVLEVIVDKEFATKFIDFLKRRNYPIIGKANSHYFGKLLADYENKKQYYTNIAVQMATMAKEYEEMLSAKSKYEKIENDDVKFYFLPYKEDVANLCEFIEKEKDSILKYALKNDITILMNVLAFSKQVKGFIGFNFLDEDNENETISFQSSIYVTADFNQPISIYNAAVILNSVTSNEADLELMGVHILTE